MSIIISLYGESLRRTRWSSMSVCPFRIDIRTYTMLCVYVVLSWIESSCLIDCYFGLMANSYIFMSRIIRYIRTVRFNI